MIPRKASQETQTRTQRKSRGEGSGRKGERKLELRVFEFVDEVLDPLRNIGEVFVSKVVMIEGMEEVELTELDESPEHDTIGVDEAVTIELEGRLEQELVFHELEDLHAALELARREERIEQRIVDHLVQLPAPSLQPRYQLRRHI